MCMVAYDVQAKNQIQPKDSNVFIVTKIHDSQNCTKFVKRIFDHVDADTSFVDSENPMTAISRRVFEIENYGEDMLIRKLVGHGESSIIFLGKQDLKLNSFLPRTTRKSCSCWC